MSLQQFNNDFILKLFNIEATNIDTFHIKHSDSNVVVSIKLTQKEVDCPVCKTKTTSIKGYTKKKINHSVLHGKTCIIDYSARRYQCTCCKKTFYETNPFTLKGMKTSLKTVYNVLNDLKSPNETFTSVALRHNLSVSSVMNIFDSHVTVSPRNLSEVLSIDEVYAFKTKTSSYVCVLLDYQSKKVIDLLPSRKKDDLIKYISAIDREERLKVKIVSIDMWATYREIAKTYFPSSVTAVDKFQVLQQFTRCISRVRINEMNKFINEENSIKKISDPKLREVWYYNDRTYYVFKKFHWLLFTEYDDAILDVNCEKRFNRKLSKYLNFKDILNIMLDASPDLKEAYFLKQDLYDFYKLEKATKHQLTELIEQFKVSNVKSMNEFAKTLTNWKKEILNSFIPITIGKTTTKVNNALIENRNKVIKTIKRNSNGYTNWERFRNRCLYSLNDDVSYLLYPIEEKKRR